MVDEELLIKTSVKLYLKTIFPSNLQYTCLTVSDVSLSLIQYCWSANFQWRYAANFYRIEDYPSGTMPDKTWNKSWCAMIFVLTEENNIFTTA